MVYGNRFSGQLFSIGRSLRLGVVRSRLNDGEILPYWLEEKLKIIVKMVEFLCKIQFDWDGRLIKHNEGSAIGYLGLVPRPIF